MSQASGPLPAGSGARILGKRLTAVGHPKEAHKYNYIYVCIYIYIRIYVYMYICIYVYMYICIYVYMYICMRETPLGSI